MTHAIAKTIFLVIAALCSVAFAFVCITTKKIEDL